MTEHRQRTITHGSYSAEVDDGIADLILECWRACIDTVGSCQDINGKIWISFLHPDDAAAFMEVAVADHSTDIESIYQRSRVSDAEDVDPVDEDFDWVAWEDRCWRYRVNVHDVGGNEDDRIVMLGVHVDIPIGDYPALLARFRAYNKEQAVLFG